MWGGDMSDLECPYCGEENEVCHDDGEGCEEDKLHHMECANCQKSFVFTTQISFDYEPRKADCLNDGKHDYKETHTYPRRCTKLECRLCGERKNLPKGHPYLSEPEFTL